MIKRSRYSLQRTMIIYFLLIGFASVMVGVEFMADFHRGALKDEIRDNIRQYGLNEYDQEKIFAPIDRMRSKAMLMVGIIMLVMVIVLTMFIKNITEPLQHMIQVSEQISQGDLRRTVDIKANNELSVLGGVINEMAGNLQEISIISRRICSLGKQFVDETRARLRQGPLEEEQRRQMENDMERLNEALALLDQMIACLRFYTADGENGAG